MPPTMFAALRSLFLHIANNTLDKGTVAPRAFVDKLKKENELFRGTAHQDAHEFLIFLLNKIAEDLEEGRNARSGHSSGEDSKHDVLILAYTRIDEFSSHNIHRLSRTVEPWLCGNLFNYRTGPF